VGEVKRDFFDIGVPFLSGGVVFLLGLYGLGMITPTNVARDRLAQALVNDRATLCQQAALTHLATVGDTTPLNATGMAAREMRDALAAEFFTESGDVVRDRLVREACSQKLNA
jgi:hypothetical protein